MDALRNFNEKYSHIFEKMNLSFDDYFLILSKYNCGPLVKKNKSSDIYQIISKESGIIYAAKIINQDINDYSIFEKTNIPKSLNILSKLQHPAILNLVGFSPFDFENKPKPVVITEMCSKGSLYDLLKIERKRPNQNSEWNSTKKLINIFGIASGMQQIHSQNIIHRNLNPRNILLDEKMHPKIHNFKLSQNLSKSENVTDKEIVGDPAYVAPEIFTQKGYSQASDVYSFGFIVYTIMTNKKPLKAKSDINKIMIEVVNKNSRPKIIGSFPYCYRDLIKSCWQKDQNKRPTFDHIVQILKTDPDFIMDDVSKDEYYNYISSIYPHESLTDCDDSFQLEKEIKPSFSNKLIDINDFKKIEQIGIGDFVTVFKVQDNNTQHLFATKVMNLKLNNKRSDIEIQEQLEKRFAKPSNLLFPSILKVFGYSPYDFRNRIDPTVFTELANMTLKDVINLERAGKAPDKWNLTKKLINIYGIAAGMKYLNIKGIVHRNLNLNSILLDDSFYPKISDFKLSKYFNGIEGNKVNKEELNDDSLYIAHEIRSKGEEYISSDVYSFSIIAYEIITNESPSSMPSFNANVPDCYKNLILNCYDEDPNKRPTFDNIVDVLKIDKSFIVDGIDSQEYLNYIKLIDEYLNQTKQSEQADQDNPTISFKKVLDSHFRMESRFMVDINDYARIDEIGKGCDSLVFFCTK